MVNNSSKTGGRYFAQATLVSISVLFLVHCSPKVEPGRGSNESAEVEELRGQLELTRKERDSLLEKLDASTRARVDLDGEISRLRKELKALEAAPEGSPSKTEPGGAN